MRKFLKKNDAMNTIHIAGALFIILSSGGFGCFKLSEMIKKERVYEYLLNGFELLRINISVFNLKIEDALRKADISAGKCLIFTDAADGIKEKGFTQAWGDAIKNNSDIFCDKDINTLTAFSKRLNKGSAEEIDRNICGMIEILKREYKAAKDRRINEGKLYLIIPVLTGIFTVFILM